MDGTAESALGPCLGPKTGPGPSAGFHGGGVGLGPAPALPSCPKFPAALVDLAVAFSTEPTSFFKYGLEQKGKRVVFWCSMHPS